MMSAQELRNRILSPETLVPVGVLFAFLGPIVIGTWIASATFAEIRSDISELKSAINKDQWTYSMERSVWQEFRWLNPSINVPDLQKIHYESRP